MVAIKRKVLIIEDNADLQEIYKLRFMKAGFEVELCNNGLEGVVKAVQSHPSVILLDIMMPQMSGYEVLEAIQKNSSIRLPIIVCSNLSQEEDIQKAMNAGADLYLCKSDHSGSEMVNKVIDFMKEQGIWDEPQAPQPTPVTAPSYGTPQPAPSPVSALPPMPPKVVTPPAPNPITAPPTTAPVSVAPQTAPIPNNGGIPIQTNNIPTVPRTPMPTPENFPPQNLNPNRL